MMTRLRKLTMKISIQLTYMMMRKIVTRQMKVTPRTVRLLLMEVMLRNLRLTWILVCHQQSAIMLVLVKILLNVKRYGTYKKLFFSLLLLPIINCGFNDMLQVEKEDFILAEFMTKKGNRVEYVGKVLDVRPEKVILVSFMKQYMNRRREFCFPNVSQIEEVLDLNIISILPKPIEKRGKFSFPYDIL